MSLLHVQPLPFVLMVSFALVELWKSSSEQRLEKHLKSLWGALKFNARGRRPGSHALAPRPHCQALISRTLVRIRLKRPPNHAHDYARDPSKTGDVVLGISDTINFPSSTYVWGISNTPTYFTAPSNEDGSKCESDTQDQEAGK
ncbi:hypothetical protein BU24DRAFT_220580 [Aaosphaeria arxii CBS 175.79]|uniref:Uncharacterized protein n=1 Tax=Aaosphaeria arxii CBS 175.79 TaxID=1450172 RepID=A0A6A5XNC4_9PLEO|nr:uncharacterized protein BU24DRAFT_220580 [Aaosphaeria arxii CBS 175.79]KAF2014738.1 hypothetical protein BU24DRAFT_220580 [Aaosphaeria arxii CBS 175.79]